VATASVTADPDDTLHGFLPLAADGWIPLARLISSINPARRKAPFVTPRDSPQGV
jgi:hypothetical protein